METPKRKYDDVLKVVHPKHVEVFREPVTAAEIMRRYPRHCIARPDVFEFPWIVVRPESVLVPGKVFYLVPYHTMHNLLKAKTQPPQSSSKNNQSSELNHHFHENSTTKHQPNERNYRRQTPYHHSTNNNLNDQEYSGHTDGQDSDSGSLYKSSFYKSWNEMRRNFQQAHQEESFDHLNSRLHSLLDGVRSDLSMMRPGRAHVESPEQLEFRQLKSCMRKPDSERKMLNLKVSFTSPVVNRRGFPCFQQDDLV
ncbi:hypothetical protein BUALT_Bualt13G0119100 [Buddleja alternifolia]|uniref:Uncharacterized protein n=1 Tax=Buddleja alternifolia TaxID=168488 RepID=A0AAV6WMH3_9LAMI|nr:hypothetical protein BUALT_Bualt13G0119100 [Buddleja alternifolia]